MTTTRVLVCQLGPRRRYAVARAYAQAGALEGLVTDLCAARGWPALLRRIPVHLLPQSLRRIAERVPLGIPRGAVHHFPSFGLSYAARIRRAPTVSEQGRVYVEGGKRFGDLTVRRGFGNATAVHVFNTAGVEILMASRQRGLRGVVDQTNVPYGELVKMVAEAHALHPDWEPSPEREEYAGALADRERVEWDLADRIVCGSEFVRQSIAAIGGPAGRCAVVPTGIDLASQAPMRAAPPAGRPGVDRPLRVLTVGHVNLRKGVAAIHAAAKALGPRATFRWVGPPLIQPSAIERLSAVVEVVGSVPRSALDAHYHWADVFLLPSVVEGSAVASYEAMAQGLPLVCTPNAGSIARDGIEGRIVAVNSAEAVVAALEEFLSEPDRLETMGRAARQRLEIATLVAYASALVELAAPAEGSP